MGYNIMGYDYLQKCNSRYENLKKERNELKKETDRLKEVIRASQGISTQYLHMVSILRQLQPISDQTQPNVADVPYTVVGRRVR